MKLREYRSELLVPRPRDEVFSFFADPRNLGAITPPWLRFRTLTALPVAMSAGAVIDHRLTIRGLPVRWRTRIALFEPPFRFIDEQIKGPYRLWVHEHTFEERGESTLIRDVVRYSVPFDRLVHDRFVRPDIERIFAFRERQLLARFGTTGTPPAVTPA